MEFEKINYEELKLKPEDKVEQSIIYTKNNDSNNSEVKISKKETKRAVKELSTKNKSNDGIER